MSLYVNNIDLKEAYFNGNAVSSIYYNGVLAWELSTDVSFDWGGETVVSNATWWKNLRSWVLATTPEERAAMVGKTKAIKLTTPVLGSNYLLMRCIGADQDGEKTLTFQSVYTLVNHTYFNQTGAGAEWIDSTARELCQTIYENCPAKNYIKTVRKGTCANYNSSRAGTAIYNDETVFLLSEREYGLDAYSPISAANSSITNAECCEGYNEPYSYYDSDEKRITYKGNANNLNSSGTLGMPWTRSRNRSTTGGIVYITRTGVSNYDGYSDNTQHSIAPAFVIG